MTPKLKETILAVIDVVHTNMKLEDKSATSTNASPSFGSFRAL